MQGERLGTAGWTHKQRFHDVRLPEGVGNARQCLAMDEPRAPFTPTLWEGENTPRMKQVWFPGSHVDVGGGYREDGLSAVSLSWMIREARSVGLHVRDKMRKAIELRANPLDVLHDDNLGALQAIGPAFMLLKPALDYAFWPRPRRTPAIVEENRWSESDANSCGSVHPSVFMRREEAVPNSRRYRRYHDHMELEPGASQTTSVQADNDWNPTGIYLRAGRYRFSAKGEWRDSSGHWSGPAGERWRVVAHAVRSTAGLPERGYAAGSRASLVWRARLPRRLRKLLPSRQGGAAQIPWTRRVESMPWMSLVGVVANGRIQGRRYLDHQTFLIGDGVHQEVVVEHPGYLYVFANHAWSAYQDNTGEVELTVHREGQLVQEAATGVRRVVPVSGDDTAATG